MDDTNNESFLQCFGQARWQVAHPVCFTRTILWPEQCSGSETDRGCTPSFGEGEFDFDAVVSGSFLVTSADSAGTVLFDTAA